MKHNMKLHPFTQTEPINYEDIASNSSRNLRYSDYKHLKNVDWGVDKTIVISDIIGLCGVILAALFIIAVLFLN